MSLTKEKKLKILDYIFETFASSTPAHIIVRMLTEECEDSWSQVLVEYANGIGSVRNDYVRVFADLCCGGDMDDTAEINELIKPHLERRLQESLYGVKSVKIKW